VVGGEGTLVGGGHPTGPHGGGGRGQNVTGGAAAGARHGTVGGGQRVVVFVAQGHVGGGPHGNERLEAFAGTKQRIVVGVEPPLVVVRPVVVLGAQRARGEAGRHTVMTAAGACATPWCALVCAPRKIEGTPDAPAAAATTTASTAPIARPEASTTPSRRERPRAIGSRYARAEGPTIGRRPAFG